MTTRPTKRFSLLELLLVVAIAAIFLGILIPVLKRGNDKAKELACINNLRNVSLAIQIYKTEFAVYPHGDLSVALGKYIQEGEGVLTCPATHALYDSYYVAREADDEDLYIIGCPCHGVVNYTPGKGTRTFQFGTVLHDDHAVAVGSDVTDGSLTFADGSQAKLKGTVKIVTSFRTAAGQLYTILRVLEASGKTEIEVDVTPGSKFEVVTPAAIAGVAGTQFRILVDYDKDGVPTTDLWVTDGKVKIVGRKGADNAETVVIEGDGKKDGKHHQKKAKKSLCQDDPMSTAVVTDLTAP